MAKGSRFCEWCDRQFMPEQSTAEDKEIYCSQACEASDHLEESEESDDE